MTKVVKRRRAACNRGIHELEPAINEFRKRTLKWYERHGRQFPWRSAESCYGRIIAELLLQRTQATTVAKFYSRFVEKYPSWESLAEATEEDLRELLQPIGLWRRRAHTLAALASVMVEKQGEFPDSREELERLPGISQYMASAILLLCHRKREVLLDANTARVFERVFGQRDLADIRYDSFLNSVAQLVVSTDDPVATSWAILDLAATVCLSVAPKHSICPVNYLCKFASWTTDREKQSPPGEPSSLTQEAAHD